MNERRGSKLQLSKYNHFGVYVIPELLEISLDILEACRCREASDEDLLSAHHHLWISLAWNRDLRLDDLSVQLMYREA